MEPVSPALAGGFLPTAPPGKSLFLTNATYWVSGVVLGGSDGHSCLESRLKEALSEEGAAVCHTALAMTASASRKQHIRLVFTPCW